ncbi:MAG: cofactor-independent phosphoglycerate mutase [Phycisphaerales bacterium]|nr:cofactor-independent phosphoglycerate mutase [Phycisphaerales bacterium]
MKYAIILPDGAADEPLAELDGRTVLEAARTPALDALARGGQVGTLCTVPAGYTPGSDVATLSVLGNDPGEVYSGRAPLEAAARQLPVGPQDLVFRCNFVTIADGLMRDFTAGHIAQAQAGRLIAALNDFFADEPLDFYEGVQYRHLLVLREVGELDCGCTPPHDIPDQPVARHHPRGGDAARVEAIMDRARTLLADHEVNSARRASGENPATDIWLWGQGRLKRLATLAARYRLTGASIAAVDLIRGITALMGFKQIDVPGATGFLDTDYAGKGAAAVAALDDADVVCVHIEAPDEAGHLGDMQEKIRAIEQVDTHVVAPLAEYLRSQGDWRILVAPDHPTPVVKRTHTADPPPFLVAGAGIEASGAEGLHERAARASGWHVRRGHELLPAWITSERLGPSAGKG